MKRLFRYTEHFWIILIWLIVFLLPVVIVNYNGILNWNKVFNIWKRLMPFLGLFILNHYLLVPYLFFNNKRVAYFIVSGIIVLSLSVNELLKPKPNFVENKKPRSEQSFNRGIKNTPPHLRRGNAPIDHLNPGRNANPPMGHPPGQWPPFMSTFIVSILILGFDTGLITSIRWNEKERQLIEVKSENVQNQLAFLKNQISPHFFMNTLNNIHSLVELDAIEAKESIIKLSKLMRYLLYESNDDKVLVVKEFEFIKSYVDLMQMRYSNKVDIQLDYPIIDSNKRIAPMIFTSLIENAFKHGISYKNNSFVHVKFLATENRMLCEISNSKHENNVKEEYSGIGLENTRKRLQLIYADDYKMDIIDTDDKYSVNITIPFL